MDYPTFDSGMTAANSAQRSWFVQNPVLPNYGEVQAGQAYAKPTPSSVPQVLGAPKSVQDPMLATNALMRARYAANPVTPNATPQTDLLGHLSGMLNKIFGSF